jgi:hypothetical protein
MFLMSPFWILVHLTISSERLGAGQKWTYFYLYVILDIFSRYVVGWMVTHREQAALAKRLIAETCKKQHIEQGQLTIHADRGSSMKSKAVAHLLADRGVTKTHSRLYVSNDNPYMDHVVPLVRGGRSIKNNIVPACKECNNRKKYLLPMEWEYYLNGRKNGR